MSTDITLLLRVGDLKEAGFIRAKSLFSNPKETIDMVNYIDFLAQNNAVNVDDLELPYPDRSGQEWKLTRAEVTQLFFGHLESKKESLLSNVVLPSEAAMASLLASVSGRKRDYVRRLQESVRSYRSNAEESFEEGYSRLSRAFNEEKKIGVIEGTDPGAMINQLKDGLINTNWNFHEFVADSNVVQFVNRTDVVLRFIEPQAGMNYEINCGKFRFDVRISDMRLWLKSHEHAILNVDGDYIHPHVGMSGEICFGNGQDAANVAIIGGDILTLLKLLDAMLPNYGSNPYQTIHNFQRSINKRDARERQLYEQKTQAPQGDEMLDQEAVDDDPDFLEEFNLDDDNER